MTQRAARLRARIKGTKLYVGAGGFVAAAPVPSTRGAPPPYVAAGGGWRSQGWWPSSAGPNAAMQFGLGTLRSRALQEDRNNPFAGGAADKIATQIVGSGIKPQSQCPDAATRRALQALWNRWTDSADADGMFDFYGLQWAAARAAVVQGEAFARWRVRRPEDGLEVPLQVQLLEADFVPVDWNVPVHGNAVRMGVEFDAIGRRQAYWMYRFHPGDRQALQSAAADLAPHRVPADEVAQVYLPVRLGQIRGVPWLARVLDRLRDIADYDDAEMVRKKTAALFAGFVRQSEETTTLIDEGATVQGDEDVVTLDPGTMQRLKPGEEVQFSEPAEVGGSYEAFNRQQYRAIATGLGILYEQLTGDFGTLNDRTLRAALNDVRRQFHVWQWDMMVFQFCRPAWERFVRLAELSGAITRPAGMPDAEFMAVVWVPEPWPYIHPVQDVEAQVAEVRAGFTSRSRRVSERGYDAEDIDRENAADNARADELGLTYDSDARGGGKPGAGKPAAGTRVPPGGDGEADDSDDSDDNDDNDDNDDEQERRVPA